MPKLTKRTVDAAKPSQCLYILWDDAIKGFGVVVRPRGTKSFVYQYRAAGARSRRIGIGAVSESLTAEQARKIAADHDRTVRAGGDPLEDKERRREALTVGKLLDAYLTSGKFAEKARLTQQSDRGRINRHLRPLLGSRTIECLKSEDVRRAFGAIRDGKTAVRVKTGKRGLAKVTGGEGAARMSIRVLRAIFTWAIREGLATTNPASGIQLGSDGVRTLIIEDAEGYECLFRALDRLESTQLIRAPVADCIRVLALTGARKSEMAAARWSWLHAKRATLTLPAAAHKTGKRTGAKTIALPAAALAIIARQPEGKPDDFIFQPAGGSGPLALTRPWQLARAEAGLPEGLTLHSLRHSFATQLAVQGASAAQLMGALGHAQLSTTARYLKTVEDARRQTVEAGTAGIAAALEGKPAASVTKIGSRTI